MGQTASRVSGGHDVQRRSLLEQSSPTAEAATPNAVGPNGNRERRATIANGHARPTSRGRVSTMIKKISRRSTINMHPEVVLNDDVDDLRSGGGRLNGDVTSRATATATARPRTASGADPEADAARRRSKSITQMFKRRSWATGSTEVPIITPYREPPTPAKDEPKQPESPPASRDASGAQIQFPTSASHSPAAALPSAATASTDSQPSLASGSGASVTFAPSLERRPTLSSLPDVPAGNVAVSNGALTPQRELAMDHLATERAAIRRRIAMLSGSDEIPLTIAPTPLPSSSSPSPISRPTSFFSTASSVTSPVTTVPLEEDPATGSPEAVGSTHGHGEGGMDVEPAIIPDPKDLADAAEERARSEPHQTRPTLVSELVGDLHNAVNNEPSDSQLPTEIWNRILDALGRDDNHRASSSRAGRASSSLNPIDTARSPAASTQAPSANASTALPSAPLPNPSIPLAQPAVLPPPLPIIPAGTTMIIQGIVQAADESSPPRESAPSASEGNGTAPQTTPILSNPNPPGDRDGHRLSRLLNPGSTASPPPTMPRTEPNPLRAAAMLSGTPAPEPDLPSAHGGSGLGTNVSQGTDSSSSAAELLGALLTAAASATANMLLSDPPNSGNPTPGNATTTGTAPSTIPFAPPISTPPIDSPVSSSTVTPSFPTEPTLRPSSVGTGPRPRPSSAYIPGSNAVRDRSRPRSMIGAMRDRILGSALTSGSGAGSADGDAVESLPRQAIDTARPDSYSEHSPPAPVDNTTMPASRDPIETLRERIASELMRALAQRDTNTNNNGNSASTDPPSPIRPPGGGFPLSVGSGAANPLPTSLFSTESARLLEALLPPEGSFQRFLHDTNADLRATLNERSNLRRELRTSVPVPIPVSDGEVPSGSSSTAHDGHPSPSGQAADGSVSGAAPPLLVNRPAEGLIEPRLNWWRMHRFPSRTVAAPANGASRPAGSPPTAGSTDPASTNSANSMVLIPVIVVGIRTAPTVLMQDIAAMTAAPSPSNTVRPTSPGSNTISPSTTAPPWITDSMVPPSPGGEESRTWPGRAADIVGRAITRRRLDRERDRDSIRQRIADLEARIGRLGRAVGGLATEVDQATNTLPVITGDTPLNNGEPREGTRNYLIWVIGGYYPETHPILVSPNLLLNHFDQDDFWGLADLLGQVKPPVASKEDIDRAGLQIIKADVLKQYETEGKVTSNTTDRCLICLSDYEPEEDLRIMSCKHVFHQDCVDKWLEIGRNNCPACRTKGVEVADTSPITPPSTSSQAGVA
ncbi:hypothetical protein FRB98_009235 [Tulasnella sp. 332]|nr:hypothetical protein FRB98_009235 [Tulasnella sp. 332]